MVDQLAQDYSGQPVVFIEYDIDNAPYDRYNRWWAANGQGSAYLPFVMVDSGNQISSGYVDFYNVYKPMVDVALARPAQADIRAYWWRTGNKVGFYVQVENLSTEPLSTSNSAMLHAIVYEDAHVKATDRFARAAIHTDITNLAPGGAATFKLETSDLIDVNWNNLHFVVLVDYRPVSSSVKYDMLQAVFALPLAAPFAVYPDTPTFMVDPGDLSIPPLQLSFESPSFVNWSANFSSSWFTISPTSGPVINRPTISVFKEYLSPGWQEEMVTFTTTDNLFSDQVLVKAYLGPVMRFYLPILSR